MKKKEMKKKEITSLDETEISDLPPELFLQIFSFLGKKELGKVASVSKQVKTLAEDDSLWQHPDANLVESDRLPAKEVYHLLESGNHKQRLLEGDVTSDTLYKQLIHRFPTGNTQRHKVALLMRGFDDVHCEKIKRSFASYCSQRQGSLSFYQSEHFDQYFDFIGIGMAPETLRHFHPLRFFFSEGHRWGYLAALNHSRVMQAWNELTAIIIISRFDIYHVTTEINRMSEENKNPSPIIFLAGDSGYNHYLDFPHSRIDLENKCAYPREFRFWPEEQQVESICTLWPSIDARLCQLSHKAQLLTKSELTVQSEQSHVTSCGIM